MRGQRSWGKFRKRLRARRSQETKRDRLVRGGSLQSPRRLCGLSLQIKILSIEADSSFSLARMIPIRSIRCRRHFNGQFHWGGIKSELFCLLSTKSIVNYITELFYSKHGNSAYHFSMSWDKEFHLNEEQTWRLVR